MKKIIVVGVGDYYKKIIIPTLEKLAHEGRVELIATVDIREHVSSNNVKHFVRIGEPLHELLHEYKKDNPIVILGHANNMHVPDAIDLLSHGFQVAIEKPFALNEDSLKELLDADKGKNLFLLEYYLMMKSAPLLLGYGEISKNSFYCTDSIIDSKEKLLSFATSSIDFFGKLPDIVGDVMSVRVDVLEGEGDVGKLDHRGPSLIDVRMGGGMLQDLGIHALAPIVALESYIGDLFPSAVAGSLKVAWCEQYASMAEDQFGLKSENIGESYAEFTLLTSKKIPISVRIGKYVFGDRNERGITIQGTKGTVFLDMNSCVLFVNENPVLGVVKDSYKYYAVIRAMVEFFDERPLYQFEPNTVAARAQEIILAIQKEASKQKKTTYYEVGTNPEKIFS